MTAFIQVAGQLQCGIHVVAQTLVGVVPVIQRVRHLVRKVLGLPQPLGRQHPCHRLQQQTEKQQPGGEGGFHRGGFYRSKPRLTNAPARKIRLFL